MAAIGPNLNDGANSFPAAGHIRVFEFQNNEWTQLGLDLDGDQACDQLGATVSLSGDGKFVAIGVPTSDVEMVLMLDMSKGMNGKTTNGTESNLMWMAKDRIINLDGLSHCRKMGG